MNKIKLTSLLVLMSIFSVFAQKKSVQNVLNFKSAKDAGEIIENNKLVGYYIFYLKEKVDKKTSAYEVEIYDDNYNVTKNFEIIRPKNTVLLEMVYNGNAFMIHFYDSKTGYEFATFDRTGKATGSKKIATDDISRWDLARVQQNLASATENVNIFPNGKEGFIRSTFTKNKKTGYEIVAYDNNAKELWKYSSKETSDVLEFVEINDVSANVLSATVSKKKNMMTRDVIMYCLLLDSKSGKLIKEMQLGSNEAGLRSLLKSFVNEETGSIYLVGEYYKPKDDILKDKSVGLYLQEFSLSGKELNKKEYKWKGDIDKFKNELDPEDKKGDRPFYVFFHDVVIAKNGHIFMIGEQFIKQVSAGGVALKVLASATGGSSNTSALEIRVADMVVIEFDENKSMVDFKLIKKKGTSVLLPEGMGMYGTTTLGYYVKSQGDFDYSFTSSDKAKDNFEIVYIDADRKTEKKATTKADVMVGVISIKGGKLTQTRVPVNCTSNRWWLQPAKPGYISVTEYFRKEKRIDMRLEQLTY